MIKSRYVYCSHGTVTDLEQTTKASFCKTCHTTRETTDTLGTEESHEVSDLKGGSTQTWYLGQQTSLSLGCPHLRGPD